MTTFALAIKPTKSEPWAPFFSFDNRSDATRERAMLMTESDKPFAAQIIECFSDAIADIDKAIAKLN
jgi:hypothetical protein